MHSHFKSFEPGNRPWVKYYSKRGAINVRCKVGQLHVRTHGCGNRAEQFEDDAGEIRISWKAVPPRGAGPPS